MVRLSEKLWLLALLVAVAAGCKPKIGADCKISTDCSAAGDRLCDITAPGGYCTVYNCEPGTCPVKESLCVEFGAQRSPVPKCIDRQSPSPYGRAFCMATCDKDSDCRSGYKCEDLSQSDPQQSNDWGALLIDTDRGNKACLVPLGAKVIPDQDDNSSVGEVCTSELPPTGGGTGGMSAGGMSGGGMTSGGMSSATGGEGTGGVGGANDAASAGQGGVGG